MQFNYKKKKEKKSTHTIPKQSPLVIDKLRILMVDYSFEYLK